MKAFAYAAVIAGALTASHAQAQETPRFYAGIFAGASSPDEQTLFGKNEAGVLRDIVIDYDSPSVVGANLGFVTSEHNWGRARFEAEVTGFKPKVDALSLNDVDRVVLDGSKTSVTAGFINAWYDTPLYFDRVRFSAGAGFGMAGIDNSVEYLVANAAATGGNAHIAIPGTQVTSAYQVMAGFEVEISPSWSLVGDVRRIEISDYQAERYILNTPGLGAGQNGTLDSVLDADFAFTSFTAGIRYKF